MNKSPLGPEFVEGPRALSRGNFSFWFGLVVFLGLVGCAVFAPYIAPFNPFDQNLYEGLNSSSPDHLLGQDRLGRDILSRVIYGSQVSVLVAVLTVGVSSIVGVLLGAIAGYMGGRIDEFIMRICDVLLAFPGILLAIALMAVLGPSLSNVIIALCLMGWVGYARLVRGQVLSIREREFVQAAKASGAGNRRIILRHILPNALSPVLVEASFGMASAIVAEAGLSFLGLGVQPPSASWGSMLNQGRPYLLIAPHLTLFPGLAIMVVVMGFNFLGDGLRDMMDPKQSQ